MSEYEVITKFRVGDFVRVKYDLAYFDATVHGKVMKVIGVDRYNINKKEVVQYTTNYPDPVFKTPYNEDELVGSNPPLPPRD